MEYTVLFQDKLAECTDPTRVISITLLSAHSLWSLLVLLSQIFKKYIMGLGELWISHCTRPCRGTSVLHSIVFGCESGIQSIHALICIPVACKAENLLIFPGALMFPYPWTLCLSPLLNFPCGFWYFPKTILSLCNVTTFFLVPKFLFLSYWLCQYFLFWFLAFVTSFHSKIIKNKSSPVFF